MSKITSFCLIKWSRSFWLLLGLIKKFPLEWNVIFFPGESAPRQMKIGVKREREIESLPSWTMNLPPVGDSHWVQRSSVLVTCFSQITLCFESPIHTILVYFAFRRHPCKGCVRMLMAPSSCSEFSISYRRALSHEMFLSSCSTCAY